MSNRGKAGKVGDIVSRESAFATYIGHCRVDTSIVTFLIPLCSPISYRSCATQDLLLS